MFDFFFFHIYLSSFIYLFPHLFKKNLFIYLFIYLLIISLIFICLFIYLFICSDIVLFMLQSVLLCLQLVKITYAFVYIAMFISYCIYIECRGRVETNVVRTCDPTPLL